MIKLKPNIGILGALIRITLGFTLLSCSTAKMARRPYRTCYIWLALCGAMHAAEGIVRYCPVTALLQQTNVPNMVQKVKEDRNTSSELDETVSNNPTE